MKKKFTSLIVITLLFSTLVLPGFVPSAPVYAADTVVQDLAAQFAGVHQFLNPGLSSVPGTDAYALTQAKQNINSSTAITAADWTSIVTPLKTSKVVASYGGNDATAEAALVGFMKNLGSLYFGAGEADFETSLQNFRSNQANIDVFHNVLHYQMTVDDLYALLLATKQSFPAAMVSMGTAQPTIYNDLIFGTNDQLAAAMPTLMKTAIPIAIANNAAVTSCDTILANEAGWTTGMLIDALNAVAEKADTTKAARVALARATMRSETVLKPTDASGVPTGVMFKNDPVGVTQDTLTGSYNYKIFVMGRNITDLVDLSPYREPAAAALTGPIDVTDNLQGGIVVNVNQVAPANLVFYRANSTPAADWLFKVGFNQSAVSSTKITGYVKLQSRPNSSNGGITVSIKNTAYTATTNSDGSFEINNAPAGSCTLVINKQGYLLREITNVQVTDGQTNEVSLVGNPISLLAGDFDGATGIGVNDLAAMIAQLGKTSAMAGYNIMYDFDEATGIGVNDLAVIISNLGKTSASYPAFVK